MKKLLYILFVVCLTLLLASCSEQNAPDLSRTETLPVAETNGEKPTGADTQDQRNGGKPFEGKIAIISYTPSGDSAQYDSAQIVVQKYGENKISHVTWPDNFMNEQEQMENIIVELGSNQDIKAIVVNDVYANLKKVQKGEGI